MDIQTILLIDENVQQKNDGSTYLLNINAHAAHELRWNIKAANGYIFGHCLDSSLDSAWVWGSDYSVSGPRNMARFTADVSGLRSLARYRLYSDRVATRQPTARAKLGPTLRYSANHCEGAKDSTLKPARALI